MKGNLVMPEIVTLSVICAVFAIYGVWKYQKAETTDYNEFVERARIIEGRLELYESRTDEALGLAKASNLQLETIKARPSSQILKITRPVPVEIIDKPNDFQIKALKKVGKQIRGLTK